MENTTDTPINVVNLMDFNPDHSFAALSQVEAYWDGLRGSQLLPKRSDIDPRGIEAALEYAFILERIAPGVARLRIAGSHLSDLMGMEVRGMPITAFLAPPSRRRFSDIMEELFETPATATLTLRTETGAVMGRMNLLPLKSDMGDVSRMLGCLVAKGDTTDKPCRFDIEHIQVKPISTVPGRLPTLATPASRVRDVAKTPPKRTASSQKQPVPFLRLVKSDV